MCGSGYSLKKIRVCRQETYFFGMHRCALEGTKYEKAAIKKYSFSDSCFNSNSSNNKVSSLVFFFR